VISELDCVGAGVVLYRGDLREGLIYTFVSESIKGMALDLDEIRQLNVSEL
jgi:hypothetical protein